VAGYLAAISVAHQARRCYVLSTQVGPGSRSLVLSALTRRYSATAKYCPSLLAPRGAVRP
jgi:TPP-dependent trihydroxycyclohexane-1,2-dione (THcHDO) dehydratase